MAGKATTCGHTTILRSRWLNTRPSGPKWREKNPALSRLRFARCDTLRSGHSFMSCYSARKWERGPCMLTHATLSVKLGSTISSRNYQKQEHVSVLICFLFTFSFNHLIFAESFIVNKDRLFIHQGYVAFVFPSVLWRSQVLLKEKENNYCFYFCARRKQNWLINEEK